MALGVAGCGICWTMQSVRAALPLACLLLLRLPRCLSLAARRVLCAAALVSGVRVSDWVWWRWVWLAVAYAGRCRLCVLHCPLRASAAAAAAATLFVSGGVACLVRGCVGVWCACV
eukprot:COSAG06_NODE_2262_length_7212_cov_7.977928_7_plen_116_part_00